MAKRKRRNGPVAKPAASLPPIAPGLVSPTRRVPAEIERPPYGVSGDPGPSVSSLVRTPDEIAAMRRTGAAAQHRRDTRMQSIVYLLRANEMDMAVKSACS